MGIREIHINRITMLRIGLTICLVHAFILWRNHILPHQLLNAPVFDISIDNTFWLFTLTGLPRYIISHSWAAISMEALWLILVFACFRYGKPMICSFFLILTVLLSLTIQSYSCVLLKISVALPVIFLPFCLPIDLFEFSWKFPRIYLVFLMVSAAVYKLANGGLFYPGQMEHILLNQHMDIQVQGVKHFSLAISSLILSSKFLVNLAYPFIVVLEASFLLLVFTRKLDMLYGVLLTFFIVSVYIVLRIYNFDLIYLMLPLLPLSRRNHYFS